MVKSYKDKIALAEDIEAFSRQGRQYFRKSFKVLPLKSLNYPDLDYLGINATKIERDPKAPKRFPAPILCDFKLSGYHPKVSFLLLDNGLGIGERSGLDGYDFLNLIANEIPEKYWSVIPPIFFISTDGFEENQCCLPTRQANKNSPLVGSLEELVKCDYELSELWLEQIELTLKPFHAEYISNVAEQSRRNLLKEYRRESDIPEPDFFTR